MSWPNAFSTHVSVCSTPRYSPVFAFESSYRSQALDRIRVARDQADQQGGLGVRLGAALLPVFQRALVGAQVAGEHGPRQFQALSDAHELLGSYSGCRLSLDRMGAQGDLAPALGLQRIEALGQFGKYVAFHTFLLALSSRFNMSFNSPRSLALKSSIVSLS